MNGGSKFSGLFAGKQPIEVNITVKGASDIGELKHLIQSLVIATGQLKEKVMTSAAEFTAAFERVNVATSAIAERLRTLSGQIGSMSGAEEDAAKAQLDQLAATLEAMGATPDNPVPVPLPETPAP